MDAPLIAPDVLEQAATIRRLNTDLLACHQESVKLLKVLINVALALGLKRHTNYETVKALKGWVKDQLEVKQVKGLT